MKHFPCVIKCHACERATAQHAGDFLNAILVFQAHDHRAGSSALHAFEHLQMALALYGDLREVRDANHLVIDRKLGEFFPDSTGRFAAHIAVDLVKNKQRNPVMGGQNRLGCKHDPGHFPAGSRLAQVLPVLPQVRGKLEFNGIRPAGPGADLFKVDAETAVGESELLQLLLDGRRQATRFGLPFLA